MNAAEEAKGRSKSSRAGEELSRPAEAGLLFSENGALHAAPNATPRSSALPSGIAGPENAPSLPGATTHPTEDLLKQIFQQEVRSVEAKDVRARFPESRSDESVAGRLLQQSFILAMRRTRTFWRNLFF